jgi:hypothetical protein
MASWFETREDALLTMRGFLLPSSREAVGRGIHDLIPEENRDSDASRRLKPPNDKVALERYAASAFISA